MKNFRNKINPLWDFSQNGYIWKIFFADKDILCGETRDINSKKNYIFSININTGIPYLKNFEFEHGNFWNTIQDAGDSIMIIGKYTEPGIPDIREIILIDAAEGKTLWENKDLSYFFMNNGSIYGYEYKNDIIIYYKLCIKTGEIIKVFSEPENRYVTDLKYETEKLKDKKNNYLFPVSFNTISENHSEKITAKIYNKHISGKHPEYIHADDYFICNSYTQPQNADTGYQNKIFIFNSHTGNKLYEDTLNQYTKYYIQDNFFLRNYQLYYFKEKTNIISIRL